MGPPGGRPADPGGDAPRDLRDAISAGIATVVALGAACTALIATGARPAVDFIVPGALGPSASLVRTDFGASAVPPGRTGYDGQQFYAIARFFPHLTRAARYLDWPRYRLLRIGAPAIASIGGRGAPVVVILIALNVLGIGLAVGAVTALAAAHGRPSWIGYLAIPPLVEALVISTSEPLAFGLALVGVVLADRKRHGWAVMALVAAALVRETTAVVGLAAAAGLVTSGALRLRRAWPYLVPAAVIAAWAVALGWLFPTGQSLGSRVAVLGMLHASGPSIVVAAAALGVSALGAWSWKDVPSAWPVVATFGAWILIYTADTADWLALPRTTAPAIALGLAGAAAAISGVVSRRRPQQGTRRGTLIPLPAWYPAHHAPRPTSPRMGDQAVPAGPTGALHPLEGP